MRKVPDNGTQAKRRTSERLRIKREKKENCPDQGRAEGSGSGEGFIQDQIIIAPEIMRKILGHLDVRNLKKVRLVCKSWLLEAQVHMEERASVWLSQGYMSSTKILEFMETRKNKLPALPQPFSFVQVELNSWRVSSANWDLSQLSHLHPLEVLTRFSTQGLPLTSAIPLIIQCSSSLEYLQLYARDSDAGYRFHRRNQSVTFPKLQSLLIEITLEVHEYPEDWHRVSRLVAWIMKVSPNVESFEISSDYYEGEYFGPANYILFEVDLRNLRTLSLQGIELDDRAAEHLISTPFSKLENLRIWIEGERAPETLLSIVKKAAASLRMIELAENDVFYEVKSEFPECPNVQKLQLGSFPNFNEFVARCFPSLKDFDTSCNDADGYDQDLEESPAYFGVKTFRLWGIEYGPGKFEPTTLFTIFPALESLHIHDSFLFEYSRMKLSGDQKLFSMLEGLKHLTLTTRWNNGRRSVGTDFSWLVELKGIETLTLPGFSPSQVMQIPAAEMPALKVLRFDWENDRSDLNQLLEFVKAVNRVEIINCCSVLRERNSRSKDLLDKFFDSAPNVVCGCIKAGPHPFQIPIF